MKLVFIRHGDPDYVNDTLTETGVKEAKLLVPRVKALCADEVYVSPLGRARDTAKYALPDKQPEILDWLREFPALVDDNNGGKTIAWDLMPSYWTNEDRYFDVNSWYDVPLMKTGPVKETYKNVCNCFDEFLKQHGYERDGRMYNAVAPNRKTVVFFCHFGIESVFLAHLFDIPPHILWQGFAAAPTSVTTVYSEEREQGKAIFRCTEFGDTSHLYAAGEKPSFSARFCETYSNTEERH